MADPFARKVGEVFDMDNRCLSVGVDHDTVALGGFRLNRGQMEELAHLLVFACWAAGQNARRLGGEVGGG